MDDIEEIQEAFGREYCPKIEALGYDLDYGEGWDEKKNNWNLHARIQPLEGSPDPIPDDLLARIKEEIIPKEYRGLQVEVKYIGYAEFADK